jgi:hypothetical protein
VRYRRCCGIAGALVVSVAALAVTALAGARTGATPITSCTTTAVQSAIAAGGSYVFQCGGTITPPVVDGQQVPFTVPSGDTVSLDATGASPGVVFDGGDVSQLFAINGGSLTLISVTVQTGLARGTQGTAGIAGAAGATGADGTPGKTGTAMTFPTGGGDGKPGAEGGAGTDGSDGGDGLGGAIDEIGGSLTLENDTIQSNVAQGGQGGNGGAGGAGGGGGTGGTGGSGFIDQSPVTMDAGAAGGGAGAGGRGGNGGKGGAGGAAMGGAIYSTGALTVTNTVFSENEAQAGDAGAGAGAGRGGNGGAGGAGGFGGSQAAGVGTDGGDAGKANDAGAAGDAETSGKGGDAAGGAIYATGALTLTNDQFSDDVANGGDGGNPSGTSPSGGTGGNGGGGGMGGSFCGNGGDATGPGSGGMGGETKPGGNGGKATGGAIATAESASESGVQFGDPDADEVNAGGGGRGSTASAGGAVGNDGVPGQPGASSETLDCIGSPGSPATTGGTPGTSGSAASAGSSGTATDPDYSGPAPQGAPPTNTSPPSISGLAKEGHTLTEVNGTWTPSPDSRSYQWEDCNTSGSDCSAIAGADKQTYQLTIDDVGSTIRVTESATADGVTSDPVASAQTAVVTPLPPVNMAPPTISGSLTEGQFLTEAHGTWTNDPTSYSYQWEDCNAGESCSSIPGATAQKYRLTATDIGHTLRVAESAANSAGASASVTSAPTAVVEVPGLTASLPAVSSPPAISGSAIVGTHLTASSGAWSGNPVPSFSYQWQRCKPGCADIAGATADSYKLTSADKGGRVRVVVAATNSVGTARANSAEVGPVTAAGPSSASIDALLRNVLEPKGKPAKIGALLKAGGYRFSFKAPSPGRLRIGWALPSKVATAAAKLVHPPEAVLSVTFHKAGIEKIKIVLSSAGRRLLKHVKKVKLVAMGVFTVSGGNTGSASKVFMLKK